MALKIGESALLTGITLNSATSAAAMARKDMDGAVRYSCRTEGNGVRVTCIDPNAPRVALERPKRSSAPKADRLAGLVALALTAKPRGDGIDASAYEARDVRAAVKRASEEMAEFGLAYRVSDASGLWILCDLVKRNA